MSHTVTPGVSTVLIIVAGGTQTSSIKPRRMFSDTQRSIDQGVHLLPVLRNGAYACVRQLRRTWSFDKVRGSKRHVTASFESVHSQTHVQERLWSRQTTSSTADPAASTASNSNNLLDLTSEGSIMCTILGQNSLCL
jgi:hypothetical protein